MSLAVGLVLSLACGLVLVTTPAGAAASNATTTSTVSTGTTTTPAATIAWNAPVAAGAGNSTVPPSLGPISCPTTSFCAGIATASPESDDAPGPTTFEITNGPAGESWVASKSPVGVGAVPTDVSCPTANLCVAVDNNGDVSRTTDPQASAPSWSAQNLESPGNNQRVGNYAFTSISCPEDNFCAAVDLLGDLWTSTDPASGGPSGGTWQRTDLAAAMTSVSCTSASFCVIVADPLAEPACDTSGASRCPIPVHPMSAHPVSVLVSTDPGGGVDHWKRLRVSDGLDSVSCVSNRRCIASGSAGLWVTSAPSSQKAWKQVQLQDFFGESVPDQLAGDILPAVACPSTHACVVLDGSQLLTSADPGPKASAWHTAFRDSDLGRTLTTLACAAPAQCLASDGQKVFATARATGGTGVWHTRTAPVRAASLGQISCPSAGLCVTSADNGVIDYSTTPGAGGWQAGPGIGALGLACPTTTLCVATVPAGLVASSDPTGPASTWQPVDRDLPNASKGVLPGSLSTVACASATLCLSTGAKDDLLTSLNPAVAGSWNDVGHQQRDVPADEVFVACTTGGVCISSGSGDSDPTSFLAASDPASATSWQPVTADPQDTWTGAWCGLASMCLLDGSTEGTGGTPVDVLGSDNPTGGDAAWALTSIPVPLNPPGPEGPLAVAITALACATSSVCFAVDSSGTVWTSSQNPSSAAATWSPTVIDPGASLTGIACPSPTMCVATDDDGDILSATITSVARS